jgi:hypothetical protein
VTSKTELFLRRLISDVGISDSDFKPDDYFTLDCVAAVRLIGIDCRDNVSIPVHGIAKNIFRSSLQNPDVSLSSFAKEEFTEGASGLIR